MTQPIGGDRRLPPPAEPTAAYPTSAASARDVPPGGTALDPGVSTGGGAPLASPVAVPRVQQPRDSRGSRDSRDSRDDGRQRRRTPLAWLPWALLAALLTLLALALLAGSLAGPDADARTSDRAATAPRPGAAAAGPAAAAGVLTAGSVDVLADEQSLRGLADLQGEAAVGRKVLVESVVADEGFWVGSGPAQRTFVFLTPQARRTTGESGYQVEQGQTVDLNGTVTGLSADDVARLGVTDAEGADQLAQQGAYIRATQVRLSES